MRGVPRYSPGMHLPIGSGDHNIVVTMKAKPKTVPAAEFKAHCLSLLDEVAATGKELIVTKHGRPVAVVAPAVEPAADSLAGSIVRQGDLISPLGDLWDAEQ